MSFYGRNWYYAGGMLFIVLALVLAIWGQAIEPLRLILLLSFMALLIHQLEEYGFPGGFPAVFNMALSGEKEAADRYPLNWLSAFWVNVGMGYSFYLLPVLFPGAVWLGLGQILFGMAGQLVFHGIVVNRKLNTLYNPGFGSVLLLHVPIGVWYIWYVYTHNLVHLWDWAGGIACAALAGILGIGAPIRMFQNKLSPYAFAPEEMIRFKVRERLAKISAG